jgi:hypothetical protein
MKPVFFSFVGVNEVDNCGLSMMSMAMLESWDGRKSWDGGKSLDFIL